MSDAGIDKFFALARERYDIMLKRERGVARSQWTNDPIFKREYFCNVFREDDKTTKWFRENIRTPLNSDSTIHPKVVLLAIVAFRWFNKIETWDALLSSGRGVTEIFEMWDSNWVRQEIEDHCNAPYVTGAYIIKTPNGMNKVDGVLWCINAFRATMEKESKHFENVFRGGYSMQTTCELLKHSPFLGNFMAWQICSDARQTALLKNAFDKDTWAQPGPGTTRGIGRTFYGDVDKFTYGSERDEEEIIAHMRDLSYRSQDVRYWPADWPKMAVIDIAHWACEVDKYYRAEEGGRMKRKYGNK